MSKTSRYTEFKQFPNSYIYGYQDPDLDLDLDLSKPVIVEMGCGSGRYTIELAKQFPGKQFVWVDIKSDRLHFGALYCNEHAITNTKRLWASVDHTEHCFPKASIDEIWITFPDPWPGRDRQKLTSPKYQTIYKSLLKPEWLIHLKTDDKKFFDYSIQTLQEWWFEIIRKSEDIYNNKKQEVGDQGPEFLTQTYYEQERLKEWREIYYALFRLKVL
jgi:tRNA (guanine-N7-)-methyltransferase